MAPSEALHLSLAGIELVDPDGVRVDLGGLRGVHVLVLMRHRH